MFSYFRHWQSELRIRKWLYSFEIFYQNAWSVSIDILSIDSITFSKLLSLNSSQCNYLLSQVSFQYLFCNKYSHINPEFLIIISWLFLILYYIRKFNWTKTKMNFQPFFANVFVFQIISNVVTKINFQPFFC